MAGPIDQLLGFDFANNGLSPDARQRLRIAQNQGARGAARGVAAILGQGPSNPLAASNAVRESQRDAQTAALQGVMAAEAQRRQAQLQQARQTVGGLLSTGGQVLGAVMPGLGVAGSVAGGVANQAMGGAAGTGGVGTSSAALTGASTIPQTAPASAASGQLTPEQLRALLGRGQPAQYGQTAGQGDVLSQLLPLLGRRVA